MNHRERNILQKLIVGFKAADKEQAALFLCYSSGLMRGSEKYKINHFMTLM